MFTHLTIFHSGHYHGALSMTKFMWVRCAHFPNSFRTQNVCNASVIKMRCNVRESDVLCNVARTGIDGQQKRHTDFNFCSIPGAGQAENMYSVLRCSQQKSLGDVTETQEFTEHISFAHLDARQMRIQY